MKISSEQLDILSAMEDEDFVDSVIQELDAGSVELTERETLKERLTNALNYARSLDIREKGLLRVFLVLEGCEPGYASSSVSRKALEDTPDAEQRLRDIFNAALSLSKRG